MMPTKNTYLFMTYKIIFIILCLTGLLLNSGINTGIFRTSGFNYYTILSNIVCLIYMSSSLIYNQIRLKNNKNIKTFTPRIKGSVTLCIFITFMIYNCVLIPQNFSIDKLHIFLTLSNILVHYIIPLMMIGDWLLFDNKMIWKKTDPIFWLFLPIAYFIFVTIRAQIGGIIPGTNSRYPYPFMDADLLGWGKYILAFFILAAAFLILGYLLYFVDRLIGRKSKNITIKTPMGSMENIYYNIDLKEIIE